ncbi:unnamed protein product [Dimorphilus gyrociliatus]|uniref:Uncharacterized protein n=1 Tax=Dimorphilus gyrociliatus TaxID=2664684 RepID=A0A7I8WCM1_9ANNE|nr:unnamed protein product [Dimorphilus gyrociliatus]
MLFPAFIFSIFAYCLNAQEVPADAYYEVYTDEHLFSIRNSLSSGATRLFVHMHSSLCEEQSTTPPSTSNVIFLSYDFVTTPIYVWYKSKNLTSLWNISRCDTLVHVKSDTDFEIWNGVSSSREWIRQQLGQDIELKNDLDEAVRVDIEHDGHKEEIFLRRSEQENINVPFGCKILAFNNRNEFIFGSVFNNQERRVIIRKSGTEPSAHDWKKKVEKIEEESLENIRSVLIRHVERTLLTIKQPVMMRSLLKKLWKIKRTPKALLSRLRKAETERLETINSVVFSLPITKGKLTDNEHEITKKMAKKVVETWSGRELAICRMSHVISVGKDTKMWRQIRTPDKEAIAAIIPLESDPGVKWPLVLEAPDGVLETIDDLSVGEMLVFEGSKVIKSRPTPYAGSLYRFVELHCVPYAWEWKYNEKNMVLRHMDHKIPLIPIGHTGATVHDEL